MVECKRSVDGQLVKQGLLMSLESLRQLLGQSIVLDVQEFISSTTVARTYFEGLRREGVEISLSISGCLSGNLLLLLTDQAAGRLVGTLMGGGTPTLPFNEMAISAMKETGNIVVSSFLTALEQLGSCGGVPGVPILRELDETTTVGNRQSSGSLFALPARLLCRNGDAVSGAGFGLFVELDD